MEKAREAADIANIRSAYAQAMADFLSNNADASVTTGAMTQATSGWGHIEIPSYLSGASGWKDVVKNDTVTVKVAQDGTITIQKFLQRQFYIPYFDLTLFLYWGN